jgi:hypothetical protein
MSNFLKQFHEITSLENELESKKHALLRASGWVYSSSYADCYWRWSKTIEGKAITTADADEALRLENRVTPCDDTCHHED